MSKDTDGVLPLAAFDDSAPVDALERTTGAEAKRVRLGQRLAIAEVAKKSGITGGMLSKLERGYLLASLDTLPRPPVGIQSIIMYCGESGSG